MEWMRSGVREYSPRSAEFCLPFEKACEGGGVTFIQDSLSAFENITGCVGILCNFWKRGCLREHPPGS